MHDDILTGVLLDDVALTLDELARACNVETEWVVRHVQAGVLGGETSVQVTSWRFRSGDLAVGYIEDDATVSLSTTRFRPTASMFVDRRETAKFLAQTPG